jgi:hypothetical protein
MVVAVDCARARAHPGHDRPSPSRQWLAAAVPRPAWPRQGHGRPHPGPAWLRPAAPRQPRFGHEKMELRGFEPTTLLFKDG